MLWCNIGNPKSRVTTQNDGAGCIVSSSGLRVGTLNMGSTQDAKSMLESKTHLQVRIKEVHEQFQKLPLVINHRGRGDEAARVLMESKGASSWNTR